MNKFKRILTVFMSVILLSITVGSDYFDAAHMNEVEATGVIEVAGGITAATLFQICVLVGSVFAISWAAGEVIDNQEEIARAGKNFIDSVKEIPEGWISKITDISSGQDYVFGSEALELVQDTSWEVIQGGAPNNNNDDDDDDDNKNGIINLCKSASQYVGDFFALGSTWLIAHSSELYQKWINGEEMTDAELAAIEPLVSGYCNQYDVAAQWSGETFGYSVDVDFVRDSGSHEIYYMSSSYNLPVAGYLNTSYAAKGEYSLFFYTPYNSSSITGFDLEGSRTVINSYGTNVFNYNSNSVSGVSCISFSYSVNFPVFASRIDAENYLLGRGDVTNALNYAKVYRHADWLSDDWAGQLIDPLTNIGLTLSQLLALMKALGLTAVGNNLSPAELIELIKESLPAVNPNLLPGETPVTIPEPAPGTEPVYYPSPDAHPTPTKPTPGGDTDPDPDPDPGTDADPEMSDYKVELTGVFPFCIPFDFIALLKVLSTEPEAPRFAFPVVIPALDYEETFYIDMSIFDDVAKVMRTCEKVSFIIFLMFATSKVIRW
ncbi:MAG: hypothetical protein HDR03_12585 [Lachnospiraceae bacterium]|nr:hypothetical protein [Lachnospiraceae bacterium]